MDVRKKSPVPEVRTRAYVHRVCVCAARSKQEPAREGDAKRVEESSGVRMFEGDISDSRAAGKKYPLFAETPSGSFGRRPAGKRSVCIYESMRKVLRAPEQCIVCTACAAVGIKSAAS